MKIELLKINEKVYAIERHFCAKKLKQKNLKGRFLRRRQQQIAFTRESHALVEEEEEAEGLSRPAKKSSKCFVKISSFPKRKRLPV